MASGVPTVTILVVGRSSQRRAVADDVHRDARDLRVAQGRLVLLPHVELVVDVEIRAPRVLLGHGAQDLARQRRVDRAVHEHLARHGIANERALVADERPADAELLGTRRAEMNMRPVAIRQAMPEASARAIAAAVRCDGWNVSSSTVPSRSIATARTARGSRPGGSCSTCGGRGYLPATDAT